MMKVKSDCPAWLPLQGQHRNLLLCPKIPLRFARALILLQCRNSVGLSQMSKV
jgi:hypothetical protein